tara:strand:- start:28 stop:552 length:525 start_codon:yes stop_codon:yes gene_type:complete
VNQTSLRLGGVRLRLVDEADSEFIVELRNDEQLSRHISKSTSDCLKQLAWIQGYKLREARGEEYYFIIESEGLPVGTVRIYDIRGNSFCWGSWIITRGAGPAVAVKSAMLIYDYAFDVLGFMQSHFDVRKENRSVNAFHLRMGAECARSDSLDHFYVLKRSTYLDARKKLLRYF